MPPTAKDAENSRVLATTNAFAGTGVGSGISAARVSVAASSASSSPSSSSASSSAASSASASAAVVPLPTRMALSAVAGMGAATVCHPLDVVRVQMQTFKSGGTFDAALTVWRSGGAYAGIGAAYLRQWLYGSCRMGIYSYLLERSRSDDPKAAVSFGQKLAMGSVSGAIGSFVGTPSELALVRMTADNRLPPAERRGYSGVFDCLLRISREEGPAMLWRGAAPTVARATLLSSASLAVTSQSKGYLKESGYFGKDGDWLGGYPVMLCATTLSSFCANVVANPFDVVKSRMQQMPVDARTGEALYRSSLDCATKSLRAEGPAVFYKGFVPAFVKLAPYSIISLTLADKLTRAVTGKDAL